MMGWQCQLTQVVLGKRPLNGCNVVVVVVVVRPHRSTTYVDAAYCYTDRVAWFVGRSVCLSVCLSH